MKNYQLVAQWATTLNADKALSEIQGLKAKYPWLKCDESISLIEKMATDLPKIAHIIKLQEKQNLIHRKFIEVSQIADEAIVKGIEAKYGL